MCPLREPWDNSLTIHLLVFYSFLQLTYESSNNLQYIHLQAWFSTSSQIGDSRCHKLESSLIDKISYQNQWKKVLQRLSCYRKLGKVSFNQLPDQAGCCDRRWDFKFHFWSARELKLRILYSLQDPKTLFLYIYAFIKNLLEEGYLESTIRDQSFL